MLKKLAASTTKVLLFGAKAAQEIGGNISYAQVDSYCGKACNLELKAARSVMKDDLPKGKRKLAAKLGTFLQQYAQKAEAGRDPNDRPYSRGIERKIKRMRPEMLQALIDEM